jgi:L-histidine N-alpha-methyltransferase
MAGQAIDSQVLEFAREVRAGLTKAGQKELPCKYLYDEIGTALFEVITLLPEYGLTRADARLLHRYAGAMLDRIPAPLMVTELGSGSGTKTRWILEACARRGPVIYYPIDISRSALARCRQELETIGGLSIVGFEQGYLDGLREVVARRAPGQSILVLFLGSTIGNFERPAAEDFLCQLRQCLLPGDALLLGTDLEKPVSQMLLAYDDPTGVTAAFNLNLLARINRDLGGEFALGNFQHEARYNARERRIEMHLRSSRRQSASIRAADLMVSLTEGETIWTESCRKFQPEEIPVLARHAGFDCDSQWIDPEWPFAESLLMAS